MSECGRCTLCCELLPVPWMDSPADDSCKECDVGVGCKIWNNGVSNDCRNFQCIYNELDNLPIELRPDRCKIIFENVDGSIFLGTMHPNYNEAYKDKIIENQVKIILKKGISIVFTSSTIKKSLVFPSQGRQILDVWLSLLEKWKEKQTKWEKINGSTFTYN